MGSIAKTRYSSPAEIPTSRLSGRTKIAVSDNQLICFVDLSVPKLIQIGC
jgi:hypothetical protein